MVIEMERWRFVGYLIPAATASMLAVALWMRNALLAFGILAGAIGATFLYSEWVKKRGEVFDDERTLKIDEMSSRRTLQILVVVLAFIMVGLFILSKREQSLRSAYYLVLGLMLLVSTLKILLKFYYYRVM